MATKAKRPKAKPKARHKPRVETAHTHVVTGRDANGRVVASEKGDRPLCDRTASTWQASGLAVNVIDLADDAASHSACQPQA